jgi:hypothetical protein
MNIDFLGAGIWARHVPGMDACLALLDHGELDPDAAFIAPRPEAIAPRERRRAGLMINLAVTVAHEACERAGLDKSEPASVFASAMGDTAITDYMCRKLAAPEKLLSPTKFHNSVHNAPSGYWTISAGNRAPSSFVGGFRESFGAGLLEASSQAIAAAAPVLLVASDIACEAPFDTIEPVQESLGIALVVAPAGWRPKGPVLARAALAYRAEPGALAHEGALAPDHPWLAALAQANPVGAGLTLVERLCGARDDDAVAVPAAPAAHLEISFEAQA